MNNQEEYPVQVFVSLSDLLKMEGLSQGVSFLAKRQKVKSVLGGKHASKLRGRGMDFEEVRAYVPGDDIRNIDWKVTARTQKTHSKVFSEEKEKPALIVVDQSRSMLFGSQQKTKAVVAAEIAALAAFKIQKEGDRVGGVVFAEESVDIIYPKRNKKNTLRFLERIVHHNRKLKDFVEGDRQALLEETISKVNNIVTHDFLVILISDFVEYSEKVTRYLSKLSQHNDVMLFKVNDPMERDIPKEEMVFGNRKEQFTVKGNKKDIKGKFETGYDEDVNQFEAQMLRHHIPMVSLNTVEPIEQQLKKVFY